MNFLGLKDTKQGTLFDTKDDDMNADNNDDDDDDDDEGEKEFPENEVLEVLKEKTHWIYKSLKKHYGGSDMLFVSLDNSFYSLSRTCDVDDILNEVTYEKLVAYRYVADEGMKWY